MIQRGVCRIYHEEKWLIQESTMSLNWMFMLFDETKDDEQICMQTISEDAVRLWHECYGHLSFRGMKTLQSKGMVRSLPTLNSQNFTCSDCLVCKQPRKPIPKRSTWRAKEVLDLVHSDIYGPSIRYPPVERSMYCVSLMITAERHEYIF